MNMIIKFIRLLLCLMQLGFVNAHVVCMGHEVYTDMITMNCTVDHFVTDVDIKFPNDTGGAYCSVPLPSATHGDCKCNLTIPGDCTITQNIQTKTTTVHLRNTSFTALFGWYKCAHGSHAKSLMVERCCACRPDNADCDVNTFTIIMWNVIICVAVSICTSSCVFSKIPGIRKLRKWITSLNIDEQGYQPLKNDILCATCDAILTCALCCDCKDKYFCDLCCKHHQEMNSAHTVFQTQQIAVNQRKVYCTTCTKIAERFCTNCWSPFCTSCTQHPECDKKEIIIIFQTQYDGKRQKSVVQKEKLDHLYKASFKDDENPVRVCGIAYLEDETVVVIDGNNWKLIAFKSRQKESFLTEKLTNEPNAITSMTGSKFAVTFPYKKYIQIYVLNCNTAQHEVLEVEKIETECKPFNISYNQCRFAVEVGEREDGRIAIIDRITNETKTMKCNDAFFTGHTIRLALDQNRLFVSAMGKKMVSCMDIDGKKLWHRSVPSPRAIIVAENYSASENILLASKRCNAIYELKKEKSIDEIVKASNNINSPRYMAYHSNTKTLCVVVKDHSPESKDELAFLKLKDAELEESNSPADDLEMHRLTDHPVNEIQGGQ